MPDCITMHNELEFGNNDSLYALYQSQPDQYRALLEQHGVPLHPELIEKAKKTPAVHDVGDRKWPVSSGEAQQSVPGGPVPVAGGEE